jgi:tripartite-type tricarboxylate transporter receptor subunit TctC
VARIEKASLEILAQPEMRAKLTAAGFEVQAKTGKDHMARVTKEVAMYHDIIGKAGIQPQ